MQLSFGKTVTSTDKLTMKVLFDGKVPGRESKDRYPYSKPAPILPNPRHSLNPIDMLRMQRNEASVKSDPPLVLVMLLGEPISANEKRAVMRMKWFLNKLKQVAEMDEIGYQDILTYRCLVKEVLALQKNKDGITCQTPNHSKKKSFQFLK